MPAVLPARPVAGAVVATDWGDEIHDRVLDKVSGTKYAGPATSLPSSAWTALTLATRNGGGTWLSGTTLLQIPAGRSGLYLIAACGSIDGLAAGVSALVRLAWAGSSSPLAHPAIVAGRSAYWSGALIAALNDGHTFGVEINPSAAGGTGTVWRIVATRIGDAWGP